MIDYWTVYFDKRQVFPVRIRCYVFIFSSAILSGLTGYLPVVR